MTTVLVTGATGFVGTAVVDAMRRAPWRVLRGVRRPQTDTCRRFDLDDEGSLGPALVDVDVVVFLVHGLTRAGYERWEQEVAARFAGAARAAGVQQVVYLGGIPPSRRGPAGRVLAEASPHMTARAATGVALRGAADVVVELRTGIVLGAGGASSRMLRDVAVRCPILAPAPWLAAEHQPVAVEDVAAVIVDLIADLRAGQTVPPTIDLAGPTTLPAESLLRLAAALVRGPHGMATTRLPIPDAWLPKVAPLVCRSHPSVVRALLGGATGVDYVALDPQWTPRRPLIPLREAMRRAWLEEERTVSPSTAAWETVIGEALLRVGRWLP